MLADTRATGINCTLQFIEKFWMCRAGRSSSLEIIQHTQAVGTLLCVVFEEKCTLSLWESSTRNCDASLPFDKRLEEVRVLSRLVVLAIWCCTPGPHASKYPKASSHPSSSSTSRPKSGSSCFACGAQHECISFLQHVGARIVLFAMHTPE